MGEETKLREETRKILELPDLPISATCEVRVVVGHAKVVWLETEQALSPKQAEQVVAQAPGVKISQVPRPGHVVGIDEALVRRVRPEPTAENWRRCDSSPSYSKDMRVDQTATREQTIADYLAVVRRYVWWVLLAAIVVPVAAYLMSARQPKVFQATSEVLLNRQDLGSVLTGLPTTNTVTDPNRYARTQAELAGVPDVARAAINKAGVEMEPLDLIVSSSVTPREDSDLLTFAVRHSDPGVAASLATAYANAFTAYKLQMETSNLVRARRELQGRLAELRRTGGAETEAYRQLAQKSQDIRTLELLLAPASVVRTATSGNQIEPTPRRNAMLGVMLGLFLGLGGAFVLNALDRRIRDVEEVERELRIPLLARLPTPSRRDEKLTILDRPPDEMTEAMSRLRANFDFANKELHAKLVMVTSAGAREGKSTTTSNLAVALSRTGRHVVLVDLDLRRPAVAQLFHLADRLGLTDAATGTADFESVLNSIIHSPARSWPPGVRDTDTSTGLLEVVTAGRTRVDPAELVETPGLTEFVQRLRSRADIVLIDAPPILAAGDAMALTAKVDAILLVNRLGTLTRPALRDLTRALDRSPAPALGFVATGAPLGESYYTYRADEKPAAEVARLRKQAAQQWAPEETPAAREVSVATGRWARPTSGR